MEYNYNNDLNPINLITYMEESNNYNSDYDNNSNYNNNFFNNFFDDNLNKGIDLNEEDSNIYYDYLNKDLNSNKKDSELENFEFKMLNKKRNEDKDNNNNDLKLNEKDPKPKKVKFKILNKKSKNCGFSSDLHKSENVLKIPIFKYSKEIYFFLSLKSFIKHINYIKNNITNKDQIKNIYDELMTIYNIFYIDAINLYNTCKKSGKVDKSGYITNEEEQENMKKITNKASEKINIVLNKYGLPQYFYKTLAERKQLKNIPKFHKSIYFKIFPAINNYLEENKNIQTNENLQKKLRNICKANQNDAFNLYNSCKKSEKVNENGEITDSEKNEKMENIKNKLLKDMNILLKSYNFPPYKYKPKK